MEMDASIEAFVAARRQRPVWPGIAVPLRPKTIEEAYRLQAAVHGRVGGRVGYKVGSTSAAGQRVFGLEEPIYAGLFAADRSASLAEALARPLREPSLECEIAFVMEREVAAGETSDAALLAAVGACHIACEIIDNRYGDPAATGVPALLADDFFQAGFVLGPANAGWREQDLREARAGLVIDGRRVEGAAGDVMDAYSSLAWLARKLAVSGEGLRAGDIVLTGSITVPTRVALPAREVRLEIDGFGAIGL